MKDVLELDCSAAREAVSAHMDGELADERGLFRHLAGCEGCRAHAQALSALAIELRELRDVAPPARLRARIAERARALAARRRSPGAPLLARLAAGLIGFGGLAGTALVVERRDATPASGDHLFERLLPASPGGSSALFAALPEYQLLRHLAPDGAEPR